MKGIETCFTLRTPTDHLRGNESLDGVSRLKGIETMGRTRWGTMLFPSLDGVSRLKGIETRRPPTFVFWVPKSLDGVSRLKGIETYQGQLSAQLLRTYAVGP